MPPIPRWRPECPRKRTPRLLIPAIAIGEAQRGVRGVVVALAAPPRRRPRATPEPQPGALARPQPVRDLLAGLHGVPDEGWRPRRGLGSDAPFFGGEADSRRRRGIAFATLRDLDHQAGAARRTAARRSCVPRRRPGRRAAPFITPFSRSGRGETGAVELDGAGGPVGGRRQRTRSVRGVRGERGRACSAVGAGVLDRIRLATPLAQGTSRACRSNCMEADRASGRARTQSTAGTSGGCGWCKPGLVRRAQIVLAGLPDAAGLRPGRRRTPGSAQRRRQAGVGRVAVDRVARTGTGACSQQDWRAGGAVDRGVAFDVGVRRPAQPQDPRRRR